MELTNKEKQRLVTGSGMWHTFDCNGKLESIHLSDGPHGLRKQDEGVQQNNDSKKSTCFPTASGLACSFDRQLVERVAQAIGNEAKVANVSVVLGPGINIKRSPLCGRNFEYYSEDPYVAGELGKSFVSALEGMGVGTSLKHFAGNSQETHRMVSNSQIDERALREIYLSAFEKVVKEAKPATVMASYNRINGEFACKNKRLLTDILRKEWGYEGAVVSDWGACNDLPACIEAGMDLEMPQSLSAHTRKLEKALSEGKVSQKSFDRAVANVIKLVEKYKVEAQGDGEIPSELLEENYELAKEAAAESAVLLKNDGILPLDYGKKYAVVGALAENMRFQGGGSSHINPGKVVTAIEAFAKVNLSFEYAKGYDESIKSPVMQLENEAVKAAKNSDVVLFFGGLTDITEGEGYDRKTLALPDNQLELIKKIEKVNPNIVFVSFGGAPYEMSMYKNVNAILHMNLGGEGVGEALCELLLGIKNPCGKLAETYPFEIEDTPGYGNYATGSDDIEYRESIFVGYRFYNTFGVNVRYPFGFGLSYTSFEYSDLKISGDVGDESRVYSKGRIKVSARITNTGERDGAETVFLFVKNPDGKIFRPVRELRGFEKVFLKANESKEVCFELDERAFSVYDTNTESFQPVQGFYEIEVSKNVDTPLLSSEIYVDAPVLLDETGAEWDQRMDYSEYFTLKGIRSVSRDTFARLYNNKLSSFDKVTKGQFDLTSSLSKMSHHSLLAKLMLIIGKKIGYSMFKGKPKDDPEVMMAIEAITDGTVDCVICQGEGVVPYKVAEAIVLSANGHKLKALGTLIRREEK